MADIKLGYGIGIKATLLTPAGAVCDLRDALYVNAVLTLPNGSTMYAQDIAVDRVTNAIYVRLLADRELTAEGNYRILFNVKLADGVMYSTVAVNFANVTTDADAEYKELSLSFSLEVTDYPQHVERTGASPKVSTRQTWLVYNDEAKAYEDTGIPAEVNFSDYYTKEETDAKVVELVRLEIASISRVNTTSSINYVYNMEDYNVGDTFLVEIEQADNVNPEVQILDSESSIIGGFDLFENRYVFSKNTDSLKQIRIRAFRIDTELPSTFVAKFYKVNNIPMGYISDTSYTKVNNDIIVQPNINGYYDTDKLTLSYQWVTTPIIKSRGFSFDIDANFETYVLQVNRFYNNFESVAKVTLTSKTNIDFTQCYGWTIQFRRNDRQNIAPSDEILTDVNIQISNIQGEVFEKPLTKSEVEAVIEETAKEIITEVETVKNNFFNPFKTTPFYAHYAANGFIKDGQGRKAIASESLEDIAMMARLGYTIIEANIHKNASGDFIVIHGDTSNNPVTFGDEVIDISNDTLGSSIAISETTTEYMKANIRYNSEIEKYRTSVPTLEEFCQCCKENNIGIFAGTADRDAIAICRRYLENNIVLYNPGATIRENYKGWVFVWNNSKTATIDSLLEQADKYGKPYMCGIGPNLLSNLTANEELDEFISAMHTKGYLVGVAAVYQSEAEVRDFFRRGGDFAAAGHEVNPFAHNYECIDLDGNVEQFTTTGVIENNVITLNNGKTLKCASNDVISLGKGSLTIRFTGTLRITFGSLGARTVTSDGSEYIVITDYFLQNDTHLTITAKADSVVTHLVYKTSKC